MNYNQVYESSSSSLVEDDDSMHSLPLIKA